MMGTQLSEHTLQGHFQNHLGRVWTFGASAEKVGTESEGIFSDCFCHPICKTPLQDFKRAGSALVTEETGNWNICGYL